MGTNLAKFLFYKLLKKKVALPNPQPTDPNWLGHLMHPNRTVRAAGCTLTVGAAGCTQRSGQPGVAWLGKGM